MSTVPALIIKAAHMKERVLKARASLVEDHFKVSRDYLIADALRSTSLRPNSDRALRMLLRRGVLTVRDNLLSNSQGSVVEGIFEPVVNGSTFLVAMRFPMPFVAQADYSDRHLTLTFNTPLATSFRSRPPVEGAELLPASADLVALSIVDTAMTYAFAESGSRTPSFYIVADFGESSRAELSSFLSLQAKDGGSGVSLRFLYGCSCGPGPVVGPSPNIEGTWRGTQTMNGAGAQVGGALTITIFDQFRNQVKWRGAIQTGDGTVDAEGKVSLSAGSYALYDGLSGSLSDSNRRFTGTWKTVTDTHTSYGTFDLRRV